jgi:DNA-directed RNA polymerase subunit alpha
MENLLLPSKVEFVPGDEPNKGALVVTPCHYGYGTTLGNTLRRVLLSSLPGAAAEAFKIKGAPHEFTALEGVKEDVVSIILNLKQLAVKVYSDEPVTLKIVKKGPGEVRASDIEKNSNVLIANKNLLIATLTSSKTFEMEIIVGRGRGFKPVEEKDKKNYDLGTIVIDSIYTPIKDVGYSVEYTRVGDITNYEKLILNIETNGTITPREAVRQSTQIIMDHFAIILDSTGEVSPEEAAMMAAPEEEEVKEAEEDDKKDEPKKEKKTKKEPKAAKPKKAGKKK